MNLILKKGISGNQSIQPRLQWHEKLKMEEHSRMSAKTSPAKHQLETMSHLNSFCDKHSQVRRFIHLKQVWYQSKGVKPSSVQDKD